MQVVRTSTRFGIFMGTLLITGVLPILVMLLRGLNLIFYHGSFHDWEFSLYVILISASVVAYITSVWERLPENTFSLSMSLFGKIRPKIILPGIHVDPFSLWVEPVFSSETQINKFTLKATINGNEIELDITFNWVVSNAYYAYTQTKGDVSKILTVLENSAQENIVTFLQKDNVFVDLDSMSKNEKKVPNPILLESHLEVARRVELNSEQTAGFGIMITSFFISSPRTTEAYKKARENKNLAEIDKYADIQKAETRAEVAKIEAKAKAAVIKEYIESYMSGGVVSAAEAARMANAHLDDNARSLWYGTFSDGEKSATDMLTAFAASYIENMNAGKGGKGK